MCMLMNNAYCRNITYIPFNQKDTIKPGLCHMNIKQFQLILSKQNETEADGQRERERERERERDKQTERQTDRQTEKETDR